jgi:L-alanine-DL-glutamate epimerase-like enolase superfamily enzyme
LPVQLKIRRLELQLAHKWTIARTSGTNVSRVIVVELVDEDGIVGLGEAAPTARYKESAESVETFCGRVDVRALSFNDIPGSMTYLETLSRHDSSAKCALNIALLDGAAKKAGKSIHDYLGLGFRDNHHITSFTIGIDKPDVIRNKVAAAAEFPILKVKVGIPEDRENLRALREVAPQKTIRVDANEGWRTKEEALKNLEWLAEDRHIEYIEQPLAASTPVADWAWLKERSPLPIFGDESYHRAEDVEKAAECFHGVNVKLVKTSGISGGYDALKAARRAGLKTMIGCMIETSILISAAAHLAELCDYLDIDGNILITNDPYKGVATNKGVLSFAQSPAKTGLQVVPRD